MWIYKFLPEAKNDLKKLDKNIIVKTIAGIEKVSQNPLPRSEGGMGYPLGNKNNLNLTGFFKIKYRGMKIRVVYSLVRDNKVMNIIAVSLREDEQAYSLAAKRKYIYNQNLFEDKF